VVRESFVRAVRYIFAFRRAPSPAFAIRLRAFVSRLRGGGADDFALGGEVDVSAAKESKRQKARSKK
jgi:hypothetical protein